MVRRRFPVVRPTLGPTDQIEHACHALRDAKEARVPPGCLFALDLHQGLMHALGAHQGDGWRTHEMKAFRACLPAHVARKRRFNAIDARTTSWPGYELSLRRRKVIEEAFGWMKTTGPLRKLLHRGLAKVTAIFTFACAAYNLVRLRTLLAEPALR